MWNPIVDFRKAFFQSLIQSLIQSLARALIMWREHDPIYKLKLNNFVSCFWLLACMYSIVLQDFLMVGHWLNSIMKDGSSKSGLTRTWRYVVSKHHYFDTLGFARTWPSETRRFRFQVFTGGGKCGQIWYVCKCLDTVLLVTTQRITSPTRIYRSSLRKWQHSHGARPLS